MEITFSPGPDWISRAAEIGTIAAILISIAALTVAVVEMRRNGKQLQQEARFNYAKRAMKLHDLLMLNDGHFLELDEQLPVKTVGYTQVHLERILPIDFESVLHEAKVTHALSKSFIDDCPSSQIFEYMYVLKSCKDNYLEQARRPPAARDPWFVSRLISMHAADQKHYEIASSLGVNQPYRHLRQALFDEIERAYQI
ncbi:hypothetical protein ACIGG6_02340 [Vreelandella lionensis]|uniref:Uncharacterized protein n=1 Tax=Vreelandella lionensis TaxID=1144478 RepID=A0ABW8BNN7_9GAMM